MYEGQLYMILLNILLNIIVLSQCHEMTFNSNLLSRENPLEV